MDAQAEASPEIPLQQFMAYDFDHDSVYQVRMQRKDCALNTYQMESASKVYLGSCRAVH